MPEKHLLKYLIKLLLLSQVPGVQQLGQQLPVFSKRIEGWVLLECNIQDDLSGVLPMKADLPVQEHVAIGHIYLIEEAASSVQGHTSTSG